jgi:hypothetical protein
MNQALAIAAALLGIASSLPPVPGAPTHFQADTRRGAERLLSPINPRPKSALPSTTPSKLSVTQSQVMGPSVTLAWDASTGTNVAGYNIYIGGASGTYTNTLDAGTNLMLTVYGLSAGQTYFFAATAYDDESPPLESDFSNEISYTMPTPPVIELQILASGDLQSGWAPIGSPIWLTNPPSPIFFKVGITQQGR